MENRTLESIISFIVTVYNTRTDWINRVVNSIVNQTKPNWELIIVDDGSKEEIARFCDEISEKSSKIRIHHQVNQGVCVARNYGTEHATGRWITYIDADDWIEETYVEQISSILNTHNYLDMLAIGHDDIWGEKIIKNLWGDQKYHEFDNNEKDGMQLALLQIPDGLSKYPMFFGAQWKFIYALEFLNRYKIRNTPGLSVSEDSVFNLYAVEYANKIGYYNEVLYHYFHNSESVTAIKYTEDLQRVQKIVKAYQDFIVRTGKNNSSMFRNAYKQRALIGVESMLSCYFVNNENKDNKKTRKSRYYDVLNSEPYFSLFREYNMCGLSMYKKLIWMTLKVKKFSLTCAVFKIKKYLKTKREQ